MLNRQELEQILIDTQTRTLGLLAQVHPTDVVHPASGWTVKDVLAHVIAWHWQAIRSLDAQRSGQIYTTQQQNDDRLNWQFYREWLPQPYPAVQAELLVTHANFAAILKNTPDEQLNTSPVIAPWGSSTTIADLIDNSATHEWAHLSEIEAIIRPHA